MIYDSEGYIFLYMFIPRITHYWAEIHKHAHCIMMFGLSVFYDNVPYIVLEVCNATEMVK